MLDASLVRVAVTGAVSVGPTTADAPDDADSALTGYDDLGYVGEDGVTETRDRSSDKIKAWQNAATVREVVTESGCTYEFTLIETKLATVELYYGTVVDQSNGSVIIDPSSTGGRRKLVVDVIDGDDFIRSYIPDGEVSEVGEQVYASGEPIGYPVTITCYPSPELIGPNGKQGSVKKFYSSLVD